MQLDPHCPHLTQDGLINPFPGMSPWSLEAEMNLGKTGGFNSFFHRQKGKDLQFAELFAGREGCWQVLGCPSFRRSCALGHDHLDPKSPALVSGC